VRTLLQEERDAECPARLLVRRGEKDEVGPEPSGALGIQERFR